MKHIERLVTIAGDHLGGFVDQQQAGILTSNTQLGVLLSKKNGFFAFEAALRVFPLETVTSSYGLKDWNSENLWRKVYGNLTQGLFFFAEDIFGGQFCLKNDGVYSFDPETAECKPIAKTIDEWAGVILRDYKILTGFPLAHLWQQTYGPLAPRERLVPKKFFVMGGEFSIENLVNVDGAKGLQIRGPIARQIHSLPDGTKIELEVTDWPPVANSEGKRQGE